MSTRANGTDVNDDAEHEECVRVVTIDKNIDISSAGGSDGHSLASSASSSLRYAVPQRTGDTRRRMSGRQRPNLNKRLRIPKRMT